MTKAVKAERSIIANEGMKALALLFAQRGESTFIRSDNGPEFITKAVKGSLEVSVVRTLYIELGSPWENAYSKRFISRLGGLGDELSKREVFASLLEAKVLVKEYRNHYNHRRPQSSLGYQAPVEFAASRKPVKADEDYTQGLGSVAVLS